MASAEQGQSQQHFGDVTVDWTSDHVARVTLGRPPDNYFDRALLASVADALEYLDDPTRCRAVVLRSEGKNFCAGARLDRRAEAEPPGHIYDEALRIFHTATPIVAVCQGSTIGGGLGLALAADFRVGSPGSRFAANFARLGFHPGFGISHTLPLVVGLQHAAALLYAGTRIDGEHAHSIGLIDRIAPDDDLDAVALEMAREIAQSAPLAVRSIRTTLRGTLPDEVERILRRERAEQERLMSTNDFREGVKAMSQRRPPDFRAK